MRLMNVILRLNIMPKYGILYPLYKEYINNGYTYTFKECIHHYMLLCKELNTLPCLHLRFTYPLSI